MFLLTYLLTRSDRVTSGDLQGSNDLSRSFQRFCFAYS